METRFDKKGTNNMATCIALGLSFGSIFGVILTFLTKDIAIWLPVGIGCGVTFGAVLGIKLDKNKKKFENNKKQQ